MRLKFRRAVLSFCNDLTDPEASSLPVGVLLVGDMTDITADAEPESTRFAAAVVLQPADVNPFIAEHLSDALAIVKEHIDRVVAEQPHADPQSILHALYTMLRNSLFVSSIGEDQEVALNADSEELYDMAIGDVALNELRRELREIRSVLSAHEEQAARAEQQPAQTAATRPRRRRPQLKAQQSEVWTLSPQH